MGGKPVLDIKIIELQNMGINKWLNSVAHEDTEQELNKGTKEDTT